MLLMILLLPLKTLPCVFYPVTFLVGLIVGHELLWILLGKLLLISPTILNDSLVDKVFLAADFSPSAL